MASSKALTDSVEGEPPVVRAHRSITILSTVFINGGVVMCVEILGTRIIAPIFGTSLFVWAALLAVTLSALAAGYYFGGVAIDRNPRATLLGLVTVVGGVLLAFIPIVSTSVLRVAATLGPRGGPLMAALVLFSPSLVALGMTGPIAVRLSTDRVGRAGRGVGAVYALSTGGSLDLPPPQRTV